MPRTRGAPGAAGTRRQPLGRQQEIVAEVGRLQAGAVDDGEGVDAAQHQVLERLGAGGARAQQAHPRRLQRLLPVRAPHSDAAVVALGCRAQGWGVVGVQRPIASSQSQSDRVKSSMCIGTDVAPERHTPSAARTAVRRRRRRHLAADRRAEAGG